MSEEILRFFHAYICKVEDAERVLMEDDETKRSGFSENTYAMRFSSWDYITLVVNDVAFNNRDKKGKKVPPTEERPAGLVAHNPCSFLRLYTDDKGELCWEFWRHWNEEIRVYRASVEIAIILHEELRRYTNVPYERQRDK